jgi:hypothetical protein
MSISNANPTVATFNRYRYVAVGGETSISGTDANGNTLSYSPGREQVYLNGTMLVRAQDYTATTGTSITGLAALTVNDSVEILAFTSFAVAAGVAQDEAPSSPAEGQLWLDTNGTVPGVQITRWSKTFSGGVTAVSGNDDNALPLSYTAGYETVYRNGVLLSRTNDYTATNGTSITLIDATIANDIIEVFGPTAIGFADTYTQAQANSSFVAKSTLTTTGDIIYASAANTPERLGIGSTSQVLTVSGGVPTWATSSAATSWTAYTATTSNITVGNGSFTTEYFKQGTFVAVRLRFVLGSTSSINGACYFSLPFATSDATRGISAYANLYDDSANMPFVGFVYVSGTSNMYIRTGRADATYTNSADLSSTVPFTWATDDGITTTFVYEAA